MRDERTSRGKLVGRRSASATARRAQFSITLALAAAVLRLALDGSSPVRSVHIRGARRAPADAKYPCSTEVDACIDFAAPIRGLCPSGNLAPGASDASPSAWDFDFAVFEGEGCTGTAVTGGTSAALVCYGASDLGVPGTENKVVGEILVPGANSTQVICIAKPVTQ